MAITSEFLLNITNFAESTCNMSNAEIKEYLHSQIDELTNAY